MADVFAELVAKAKIDMTAFNKQIQEMKSKLGSLGNVTNQSLAGMSDAANKAGKGYAVAGSEYEKYLEKVSESNKDAKGSIDKATKAVDKFGKRGKQAGQEVQVAFGGIVGMALKAVATMGAVELGLGAVNTATKLFEGNIEGAAEAIKNLPAGIGPVARQLEELLGTLTGITKQTEMWERATANALQAQQKFFEIAKKRLSVEKEVYGQQLSLQQQLNIELTKALGLIEGFDNSNEVSRQKTRQAAETRVANLVEQVKAERSALVELLADPDGSIQERNDRLSEIAKDIKKQEEEIRLFTGTIYEASRVESAGVDTPWGEVNFTIGAKERLAALKTERDGLERLNKARKEELELQQEKINGLQKNLEVAQELGKVEMENLERQFKAEEDALNERGKKIREENNRRAMEEADLAAQELTDMLKKRKEAREKELQEEKEKRDKIEEELNKKRQENAKRIGNLRNDIAQKELRLQGKEFEAQIEALKQKFLQEFASATGVTERILLAKKLQADVALLNKQKADQEELKKQKGPERMGLRQRFEDTLAKLTVADRDAKIEQDRQRAERRAEKQVGILEKIRDIAKENKDILKDIDFDPRFQ